MNGQHPRELLFYCQRICLLALLRVELQEEAHMSIERCKALAGAICQLDEHPGR